MFVTLDEAKNMIATNRIFHIAGDDSLLSKLPKGNWIGGTTPYFITNEGGITTKDKLFLNELTAVSEFRVKAYDEKEILKVADNAFEDGITMLILPFASKVAEVYAREAPNLPELLFKPVTGWISGFDLSTDGTARVYDGTTGKSYSDKGIAMHIKLSNKLAEIGIINIFEDNEKDDVIEFPEDGLCVGSCRVNGKEMLFTDYIAERNIDTQMPLVANYNGVYINVSIKNVDKTAKCVDLYAPVFKNEKYRFAVKVADYSKAFEDKIKENGECKTIFACNCILNYLYGKLEGKATPPFEGPVTFGEIAYQLLNQTLVYVECK